MVNVSLDQSSHSILDDSKVSVDCTGPGLLYGLVGVKSEKIDVSFLIDHGQVLLVHSLENQPSRKSRADPNAPQKPSAPPQYASRNSSSISRYVAAPTRIPLNSIRFEMINSRGQRVDLVSIH